MHTDILRRLWAYGLMFKSIQKKMQRPAEAEKAIDKKDDFYQSRLVPLFLKASY